MGPRFRGDDKCSYVARVIVPGNCLTMKFVALLLGTVALLAAAPAGAQTRARDLCAAMPKAEAEQALKLRAYGADTLDDRLGEYRRQICRMQTEPGETIELTIWSHRDGSAFPPL